MRVVLMEIFNKLNDQLEADNAERREESSRLIQKALIKILGQTSLLIQPELTYQLSLVQTGDLDAKLDAEHAVKTRLKEILPEYKFIYDEDSEMVFIPDGSSFAEFVDLSMVKVLVIDPESALVSKAVKAPDKNRQLIREAIASGDYKNLIDRIIKEGGNLKNFI